MAEIHDLEPVDASNTARFPENQAPSSVNNGARALEGIVARYFRDNDTSVLATISASLITITANRNSLTLTGTTSNYVDNFMQAFTMGANPNTGPVRATIDGVGPISIRDNAGGSLSSSLLLAGTRCLIVKDGPNDYFRLLWPATIPANSVGSTELADVNDPLGKQTIAVPVGAMTARTTSGAAPGSAETSTNKIMLPTLDFDKDTDEFAQFRVPMPKGWNEGTVTAIIGWSHPSTSTNFDAIWGIQGVALGNDDAQDAAFGTAVTVTDTGGTTDDLYITAETGAMTIAGTPAEGDEVVFQVYRDADNGSDNLAVDARLHWVKLLYTINAAADD